MSIGTEYYRSSATQEPYTMDDTPFPEPYPRPIYRYWNLGTLQQSIVTRSVSKNKSFEVVPLFSRAVALLFNWKYFGGLKSHEIWPGMMCRQCEDMKSVKSHES